MDFIDSVGTSYQLTETVEALGPTKKTPVWPWVVGGLVIAGGLVWMASQPSRKPNPVSLEIEALIEEARNPDTSWTRMKELVKHPEVEVRRALLDNPNLCPTYNDGNLNTRLLNDLAQEFPEEVAGHPAFVLHALIEPTDEMIWVVKKVVSQVANVGLIEHVFRTWGPSWWDIRLAVAGNPRTPVDLLRTLGNQRTEPDASARKAVASNPNAPVESLRTLGNPKTESNRWVRESANKALAKRGLL